jgi:F-type H+-transporting ATPase subunit b
LTVRRSDAINSGFIQVLEDHPEKGTTGSGELVDVFRQILNLIIVSLPTTIIVFLFYLFARVVFFKPIARVMEERAARTEGARSDALRLDEQTQEKLAAYHRALDKARVGIYGEQETARRAVLDGRAERLRQARAAANDRVKQAKQRLAGELEGARAEVERESVRLAEDAVRAVLAGAMAAPKPAGDAS